MILPLFVCYKSSGDAKLTQTERSQLIYDHILFHKYRIVSLLGRGSSSSVYLVEHLKLKSYRAIKCISKCSRSGSLLPEANLLKSLRHPGIPIIYDVKEDDSYFFIIEEYIPGESLSSLLQAQNSISFSLMVSIGIQLCDIFEYLHHQTPVPVLYLDLKPEHIILYGNQIKLIDFGISLRTNSVGNVSQPYASPGFAAPEQRFGGSCTTRTDIYGVGAILYFMLTKHHLTHLPCDFFRLRNYCSFYFQFVVFKSSALLPFLRYQNIRQLKCALQKTSEAHPCFLGKMHLLRRIAVIGSQPHIGTTHFSIAFVCWLNQQGLDAVYLEHNRTHTIPQLDTFLPGFAKIDDCYYYQDFCAADGSGNFQSPDSLVRTILKSHRICLLDCGNLTLTQSADADLVIVLTGSRPWEQERTVNAISHFKHLEHTRIVCNYQAQTAAKQYTQLLEQPVYCFPLDENPFSPTPAKDRFFRLLLS